MTDDRRDILRLIKRRLVLLVILAAFAALFAPRFRSQRPSPTSGAPTTSRPHTNAPAPAPEQYTNQPEGFYLGKGDQKVFINYASPDPVLRSFMQSVMDGSSDPNVQGRAIFMKICSACHQRDGEGKDGVAPPLVGSEWILAPGAGRLVRIVLNGVAGPMQVHGREWNLSMPPWRANLDDDQIAVVLTYIRTQLGTNHAAVVTPEFVASIRQGPLTNTESSQALQRVSDQ